MLFNSFEFIFVFLPLVLAGYLFLIRSMPQYALSWLALSSIFFYSWWNPAFLFLILSSILFNYAFGISIIKSSTAFQKKAIFIIGIIFNLGLIAYFKYFNFIIDNINALSGLNLNNDEIFLPLAISFFTFQQVAYLVDTYQGKVRETHFVSYCLFVTFFPQLIAGPIVHHQEMMPQFKRFNKKSTRFDDFAIGLTIFTIGLFKKVILADQFATYASPGYNAVETGYTLSFLEAWCSTLSYTLQLYFDFSGYSDMAIGLGRLFSIRLPLNFYSPYKARNIIEFWRCWHMTLSRFLRDYLYIPLGGNKKGKVRRYINLSLTMLLGGLWHGASWNFVIWGGLHGLYLVINQFWQNLTGSISLPKSISVMTKTLSVFITFMAVTFAWIFFRAETLPGAFSVIHSMTDISNILLPDHYETKLSTLPFLTSFMNIHFAPGDLLYFSGPPQIIMLLLGFMIVFFMPNTFQFMHKYYPALLEKVPADFYIPTGKYVRVFVRWRLSSIWAIAISVTLIYVITNLMKVSEFIYFRF